MDDARREVLRHLRNRCSQLGSANSADDRGYTDQAERMRQEAQQAIAEILAAEPWVATAHPELFEHLSSPGLWSYRWSTAEDLIGTLLGD